MPVKWPIDLYRVAPGTRECGIVVKTSSKVIIGVVVAAVVVGGGVVTALSLAEKPDPAESLITEVAEVRTITATVAASGEVRAVDQLGLTFATAGEIISIDVEPGDQVSAGDVLATLDTTALDAAIAAAESTLASARDGVAAANVAEAQAQQAINNADWQMAMAQAALEAARDLDSDSNRSEEIASARARIAAAEAERDTAEYSQARVPGQKAAANAALASAQAGLDSAKANLDKASLTAPMSGTVLAVDVEVGDVVTTASADAFVVADLGAFEVTANFAEADITEIVEGQVVNIVFDALPDDTRTGTVTHVGLVGEVDPSGGTLTTYDVTVSIPDAPAKLRVGMTAQIDVITDETVDVVAVPVAALITEGDKTLVNVLDGDVIRAVEVEVGSQGGNFVEIVSGLVGGETVVIGDVGEFPVVSDEWEPGSGPPPGVEDQQRQEEQFSE